MVGKDAITGRIMEAMMGAVREFSDSYHLLSPGPDDIVGLLRHAGRFGAVLQPAGRFVAFLVEGLAEAGEPQDVVVAQNTGTLVHYAFAEEGGCHLRVFAGSVPLAALHVTGAEPASALRASITTLREHGVVDDMGAAHLDDVAHLPMGEDVGAQVAAALGLSHTARLSCADLTYGWTTLPRRYPGLRFVNKTKRIGGPSLALLLGLPVPHVTLEPSQEVMVRRHYRYWAGFGDFDNETSRGFWMYERYRTLLPTRYHYLCDRLMNIYSDRTRVQDSLATLRAIIAFAGPDVDWERTLRGF